MCQDVDEINNSFHLCFIIPFFLSEIGGISGEGMGSETGDFPAGGTAATLAARTGHLNGAGPPTNDEEMINIPTSVNCTAPQAADQYKSSHDSGTTLNKNWKKQLQKLIIEIRSA